MTNLKEIIIKKLKERKVIQDENFSFHVDYIFDKINKYDLYEIKEAISDKSFFFLEKRGHDLFSNVICIDLCIIENNIYKREFHFTSNSESERQLIKEVILIALNAEHNTNSYILV